MTFKVENHFQFTNLNRFKITWELLKNGLVHSKGDLSRLDLGAHESQKITLPCKIEDDKINDVHVNIEFRLKHDHSWAKKNHLVAWEQFEIYQNFQVRPQAQTKLPSDITIEESSHSYIFAHQRWNAQFDKTNCKLVRYTYKHQDLISSPLKLNFWRAPTDNDIGFKIYEKLGMWKHWSDSSKCHSIDVMRQKDGSIDITTLESDAEHQNLEIRHTYHLHPSGMIKLDLDIHTLKSNLPDFPKISLETRVPKTFSRVKWYGRGPMETYIDRKRSGTIGVYEFLLKEQIFNYIKPQENGNKTDLRWLELKNSNDQGLKILANELFQANVWPYQSSDLESAQHPHELPERKHNTLSINFKQMGLGGIDSWGAMPLEKYRIPAKNYHFEVYLQAISN